MSLRWIAIALLFALSFAPPARALEVYAHRGARAFNPENTMPAYQATLSIGTDWVDMDVVLTKDGEVLISHDPVLNPDIVRDSSGKYVGNGQYAAKDLTLKELEQFDVGRINRESAYSKFFPDQIAVDGTHMPTLREVVRYVNERTRNNVGFQIEMKTNPEHPEYSANPELFANALYEILKNEKIIDRAEIQAFDFRCLAELRKLNPKVKTAFLTSRENEKGGPDDFTHPDPGRAGLWTGEKLLKDYGGSIPRMVKALGGFAWEPEDAELTQEALAEAKKLGLKVVVWSWPEKLGTSFDSPLVQKMIDWNVDGIITDDPGRLISLLAARGKHVPARYR